MPNAEDMRLKARNLRARVAHLPEENSRREMLEAQADTWDQTALLVEAIEAVPTISRHALRQLARKGKK